MHVVTDPAILYFGTPVVLISTRNEDGSANLAPMSSAWWLRGRCMLGLDPTSKTSANLIRTGECVLNLPSDEQTAEVDRLALTTGSDPVPPHKVGRGYRHERDKFERAGFTSLPGELVQVPRAAECPVHMEAVLEHALPMLDPTGDAKTATGPLAFHVRIVRTHVHPTLLMDGNPNRIDPDRWRPLIMSFQQFYGLGPRLGDSRLATVPEELYRRRPVSPEVVPTAAAAGAR